MKRIIQLVCLLLAANVANAQCLTSSLTINTGYNPITGAAIAPGTNGGAGVQDPHWVVTAESPAMAPAVAATGGGTTLITPGNKADVVTPVTGNWAANPAGNPGGWINCMNSNTYTDQGTGALYTMTLGRPFRLCTDDSIKLNFFIASDNATIAADVDGVTTLPTPGGGFATFVAYTRTIWLTAGTHTINITVQNANLVSAGSNPMGLNVYGTFSSSTGTNSMVSESYASCASYVCGSTCNTLSLQDTLRLCTGGSDSLRATVIGTDPILSVAWTPAAGLSSTTTLHTYLSNATTAGYYHISVQSLTPYSLVNNGDFSAGNTGFSSSYTYVSGTNSLQPSAAYAITTNPLNVHNNAISFGDHTTGTGNMMAINGASAATSVWCQTIPVSPNTDYAFSAWAANWSTASTGAAAPILQFQINGVLVGTSLTLTGAPGAWTQFYTVWNSGANTTASICLYDACIASSGNDFALDDISFQKVCVSTDSIYILPSALDTTYTHKDTAICAPLTSVTLTAPAGYTSYRWNTTATSQSINANTIGNYWVYASQGCDMLIDTFHVTTAHVDTTYMHNNMSLCTNISAVNLTSPAGGYNSYQWSTGDHTQTIVVSTAGSYWVYAPGACTMLVDTFNLSFRPLPPAPVTYDTSYCQTFGGAVSVGEQVINAAGPLTWFLNGQALGGAPTPDTNVPTYPAGTTWYVGQTVDGCRGDSAAVKVTIIPPPAFTITAQPWVCQFDSILLSYTGGPLVNGGWQWQLPEGAFITNNGSANGAAVNVKFDSAGNQYVYLTASNLNGQCSTTDTVRIDVVALPTATAFTKAEVCLGDTVTLALSSKTTSASDFTWYLDNTPLFSSGAISILSASSNSGGPFVISWLDSGIHTFHITSFAAHGCSNPPTADTVNVHAAPDATFRVTTKGGSLCLEDSVLFSANDSNYYDSYLWSPGHAFLTQGRHAVWGRPEQTQSIITLRVTDPIGCTASWSTELDPATCCTVAFPSAFTPNGDTKNDVFRPIPTAGYHNYHVFRIQNRWGQTIFESTDNRASWDGNFNGVPQDMGVYYYYLKYDCGGKILEEKGDCTLIR